MLSCLPFSVEAWKRADQCDPEVQRLYWTWTRAFNPDMTEAECEYVIGRLQEIGGNGDAALDVVTMALHQKRTLPNELLLQVLERLSESDIRRQNDGYKIKRIIAELQLQEGVDTKRLAQLELCFVKLFNESLGEAPKTLNRVLAENPDQFVEALAVLYKPRNAPQAEESSSESSRRQVLAGLVTRLLWNWNHIPGTKRRMEPSTRRSCGRGVKRGPPTCSRCRSPRSLRRAYWNGDGEFAG